MTEERAGRGLHQAFRSAMALALIALIGTTALVAINTLTEPRIAEQERLLLLDQLQQVLPGDTFDNPMHEDFITVSDESAFPGGQKVTVFRARRGETPVAVIMRFSTFNGYNGEIRLLVAVYRDGRVSGVRVLEHRETPGLGDGIEIKRSNWIRSFEGRSLENTVPGAWAVRRDGGEFDQFTGATITPRAIVDAVRRALEYFRANRDRLFSEPSEFESPGAG